MEETSLPAEAPAPRLCHLIKWHDFDGYGFNLHAEKSKSGQFVGKVDDESPAQSAGLREGDRIIEVNGVNIANENHRQVVERIKANPRETRLLVIEEEGDQWYKDRGLVIRGTQPNVVSHSTPERKVTPAATDNESAAAVSVSSETQSREGDDARHEQQEKTPAAGDESVNRGSEPAVSLSSSCLATEVKSGTDSVVETASEREQESKSVTRESEAAVEPETMGTSAVAAEEPVVVLVVGDNSSSSAVAADSEVPQQATEANAVMNPETEVADQSKEKEEEDAPPTANGNEAESRNEGDVAVIVVRAPEAAATAVAASSSSQQKDSDQINNNNNTIEGEAIKSRTRDVADTITVQVKANGVNGHPNPTLESSSVSPAVPASPTSLKSNSSGSTSGNALSSLGSGGEGNLEMSLNMSVSQMRQMLAQKKKVDPKKVAMDLKQKYEIISSM